MILNDISKDFLSHKQVQSATTKSHVKKVCDFFGSMLVQDIRYLDVMAFVLWRRKQKAAASTINREVSTLKQMFIYLVRTGVIPASPAAEVPIERGAIMRDRWITVEEETGLIKAAPSWLKPIIKFATATGMRRGEILALKWEDIDRNMRVVRVKTSKNGKPRTIPLTTRAIEALEESEERQVRSGTAFVFTDRLDHELKPNVLEYNFRLAAIEAGIEDLHFHDLRHTGATRWIQRGLDLYVVQKLLGHSSPAMTARYSHHSVESIRERMREVGEE